VGPQVEALSEDYRVIAYDLRGHGRTGPAVDRNYTIELLAADLRALIEMLDLERPVVCGLSLGGMVAQLYAVRYGGLAGLVLAGTAASTRLTRWDRLQRLLFPRWSMTAAVRVLGPERCVDWAFRLARLTPAPRTGSGGIRMCRSTSARRYRRSTRRRSSPSSTRSTAFG
jgi:pimeloyl-ACP methyl ester carboxylesterase